MEKSRYCATTDAQTIITEKATDKWITATQSATVFYVVCSLHVIYKRKIHLYHLYILLY